MEELKRVSDFFFMRQNLSNSAFTFFFCCTKQVEDPTYTSIDDSFRCEISNSSYSKIYLKNQSLTDREEENPLEKEKAEALSFSAFGANSLQRCSESMTDFQNAVPVEVKRDGRSGVDEGASPHYEISPHLVQQAGHIKGSDFYEISPDDDVNDHQSFNSSETFRDDYSNNGIHGTEQSPSETRTEEPWEASYLTVDLLLGNNNLLKNDKIKNGDQKSSQSPGDGESNYEISASETSMTS